MAHSLPGSLWVTGASVRRSLVDGRWDSIALEVARRIWSTAGGRGQIRSAVRYDPLRSHRSATLGAEATWRLTSELAFVGTLVASVGASPGREQALAWQSVGVLMRARSRTDLSLTAGLRYDGVKRAFRMDLLLSAQ